MPKVEVVTIWVVGIHAVSRPVSSEAKHGGIKLSHVVNVDTADVRAAAESFHVAAGGATTKAVAERRSREGVGRTRSGEA